jgi:hypothetical protein
MGASTRKRQSLFKYLVVDDAAMSMIRPSDPDFRVCLIDFNTLLELQSDAERLGFATRWSSVEALRDQVKERDAVLQTLMREKREGVIRSYRCLLLFSAVDGAAAGALATIDLDLARLESLDRLDRDPDVRKAFARIFSMALGGITGVEKK